MRQRAHLSQQEVAVRLGLSRKSGKFYISSLERGEIKNPTIGTILRYLKVCGVSWSNFFAELATINLEMEQEKISSKLDGSETSIKTPYHILRSETGIKYLPYYKYKYNDIMRLKNTIDEKVFETLSQNKIEKDLIPYYLMFADEYFSLLEEKLLRASLKPSILQKIKKTVQKVLSEERKKMTGKKTKAAEKQLQIPIGFNRDQIAIEPLLTAVRKKLHRIAPQINWIMLYDEFAQELCDILVAHQNNPDKLQLAIDEMIERWSKRGLKKADLLKIKDITMMMFQSI
ncbi:MAG: helix-turn-helix domain-containing protein, partial [candidate division WOR-3 bacterium]|nr:helix-turn-helix domain-containing protein [candidate division WOR-3 bacterium]